MECTRLSPPFQNELYDFYRNNFSSRRSKRYVPSLPIDHQFDDVVYVLRSQSEQRRIVAALRLTRSKSDKQYTFLRSLCCAKELRKQGFAMQLLQYSLQNFGTSICYCFAISDLAEFYEKSGFEKIQDNTMSSMPKWMIHSYDMMANKKRNKGESLELFIRKPKMICARTRIVLLQHSEEVSKSTATGWLAEDKLYYKFLKDIHTSNNKLESRVDIYHWVWSGRNDTSAIETMIKEFASASPVFLLWTEHGNGKVSSDTGSDAVYIILDGTWQQAQAMFRKIPSLWKLPRISLTSTQQSKYILRKDYSGWKDKFNLHDGDDLLCTAETMAALLDRRGDNVGGDEIRSRLDVFQTNYPLVSIRRMVDKGSAKSDDLN